MRSGGTDPMYGTQVWSLYESHRAPVRAEVRLHSVRAQSAQLALFK